MRSRYKIHVYDWNPNGTNDVAIYDTRTGKEIDGLEEALFGVDICRVPSAFKTSLFCRVDLKFALQHVASSPVSDGSETLALFRKYFAMN